MNYELLKILKIKLSRRVITYEVGAKKWWALQIRGLKIEPMPIL